MASKYTVLGENVRKEFTRITDAKEYVRRKMGGRIGFSSVHPIECTKFHAREALWCSASRKLAESGVVDYQIAFDLVEGSPY